jgi:hypothetical protein
MNCVPAGEVARDPIIPVPEGTNVNALLGHLYRKPGPKPPGPERPNKDLARARRISSDLSRTHYCPFYPALNENRGEPNPKLHSLPFKFGLISIPTQSPEPTSAPFRLKIDNSPGHSEKFHRFRCRSEALFPFLHWHCARRKPF